MVRASGLIARSLEEGGNLAAEAGDDVLAVELVADPEPIRGAVWAMDQDRAALGVDDPDQGNADREVVVDFSLEWLGEVVGRNNLDHEVGGDLGVTSGRAAIGQAFPPCERNVGDANPVRVVREDSITPLRSIDQPKPISPDVNDQQ